MTAKVNAALADIDEAITYFTERSDVGDGDDGQPMANEAMRHDMALTEARTTLAAHIAQQDATIARMREALESIRQYGSDTLSGRDPNDGPNDRDWQREGVREMRNRARAALNQGEVK